MPAVRKAVGAKCLLEILLIQFGFTLKSNRSQITGRLLLLMLYIGLLPTVNSFWRVKVL